jgi:hypothetical protein
MALTPSTSYTQDASDVNAGTVADTTSNYGTGGNPARGDAANYLLWAKLDFSGNRTFDNPDFGDVLTIMAWSVVITLSGWYQRMLMRIQPYNAGTAYVPQIEVNGVVTQFASILYYATTNKVYKNILACTGIVPTNTTYFEEVTDLSTIIQNTNVSVTITDTYIRSTVDQKMKNVFKELGRNCGCDDTEVKRAMKLYALLVSANSEVNDDNYDDMEKIIVELEANLTQVLVP